MKKIFYFFIVLIFFANAATAQYVNIPDNNFRAFLINKYPSCFDTLGRMDTTCSSIVNENQVKVYSLGIKNLDGIQYFKKLELLDCNSNPDILLPVLPQTITYLDVSGNSLFSLMSLPSFLNCLRCEGNNFFCLPKLPSTLKSIYFDETKVKCLPNLPDSCVIIKVFYQFIVYSYNYPICSPINNPNHCRTFPSIKSFIYLDANNNNKFDSAEYVKSNIKLSLSNNAYSYTNNYGNAELYVDSLGTYIITPSTPSFYNAFPSSYTHNFNTYDTIIFDTFALKPNAIKDSISIVATAINNAARPGFNFAYKVDFENVGTTVLSPTINFNYDTNLLIFDSSSNSALVNNGSNLSVTLSNFVAGETGSFMIYFKVKTTAVLGSSLLCVASANAVSSSAADTVKTTIRGSFDPNDKFATQTLSLQEVTSKKYINYIIRFQNTGTDTAFSVVISDTLSAFLQASNYQFLSSSHPCKSGLRNGVLYFEFININLPDSGTNKNGSNGFVRFQILADESVTVGTIIPNKAYIYFDYNKGIVTNVATTTITNPLPLKLVSFSAKLESTNQLLTSWKTEDEINTSHFVIEKSFDGNIFFSIAEVAAKGNGNNPYSFLLENETKNIFLRLKIVDKDGKWYYSNIIKVSVVKYNSISISPNPARDYIRVDNNIGGLKNANGYILNAHGIIVKLLILKQGIQLINISDLPAGIYYFHTDYDNKKFIIEK